MRGTDLVVRSLTVDYGCSRTLHCSESDGEIRFQVPAALRDRQAAWRSREGILDDLAVSHRLSLLVGRAQHGIPDEFAVAIRSIEAASDGCAGTEGCHLSLRCEVTATRHGTPTALRSTLVTRSGEIARSIVTSFDVMSPALARFIRRARRFDDFADVRLPREHGELSDIAAGHFHYVPAEQDRLSDGRRVDHVPALVLIDLALCVNRRDPQPGASPGLSAAFLNYTDPRVPFDIVRTAARRAFDFVQNGLVVATVHGDG